MMLTPVKDCRNIKEMPMAIRLRVPRLNSLRNMVFFDMCVVERCSTCSRISPISRRI